MPAADILACNYGRRLVKHKQSNASGCIAECAQAKLYLIVENPAEVISIWENVSLPWQICSTAAGLVNRLTIISEQSSAAAEALDQ